MPSDNSVTLVGNVTRDPELRFTNTGQANVTFGLAVNRRWQNRQTQEWEEATSFFDVVCWREMAENVSESITRGARIMVAGRLEQRSWETQEGDKRSKVEVVADEIGPSLRWATAQITKNERRGPGEYNRGGGGGGGGRPAAAPPAQPKPAADAGPGYGFDEEPFLWHGTTNAAGRRHGAPPRTWGGGSRRSPARSAGTRPSGSTTRTSRCCAST
jgi:single-strand DNA-binding protein